MNTSFKLSGILLLFVFSALSTGCFYSSVAIHGDTALVAKSNWGGVMKNLYVCKVTPEGVTDCREKETP
ncbi:MAG: hypothetical protein CMH54_09285 [Myxococcales bacterium]|nr:hypothetical protein [Myxococcales bacterium]|tara:strand:- start:114 stop:320 length:207 start_codon:yes stop_codon:yes gene_type:complete